MQHGATEIAGRLVSRPEDNEIRVQNEIQYYRDTMLHCLEDYIIQHSQQHVIELDANLSIRDLFRVRIIHVHILACGILTCTHAHVYFVGTVHDHHNIMLPTCLGAHTVQIIHLHIHIFPAYCMFVHCIFMHVHLGPTGPFDSTGSPSHASSTQTC